MELLPNESIKKHLWSEEVWEIRQGLVILSSNVDAIRKGIISERALISEDILARLMEIQRTHFADDNRTTLYILTVMRDCLHNCDLGVFEAALDRFELIEYLSSFASRDDNRIAYLLADKGYFENLFALSKNPILDSALCETITWAVKVGLLIPREAADDKVFYTRCLETMARLIPHQMRTTQLLELIQTTHLIIEEAKGALDWREVDSVLLPTLFDVVPFMKEDTQLLNDAFVDLLTKSAPYARFAFLDKDPMAFDSLVEALRKEPEKISGFSFMTALTFYDKHSQLLAKLIQNPFFGEQFSTVLQNEELPAVVNVIYFVNQALSVPSFKLYLEENPSVREKLLEKLELAMNGMEGSSEKFAKTDTILATVKVVIEGLK